MSTGDLRRHVRESVRKIRCVVCRAKIPRDEGRKKGRSEIEGDKIRYPCSFSIREGIFRRRVSRSAMSRDENFRARSQREIISLSKSIVHNRRSLSMKNFF